ncbi:MAG: hypothetical protein KAU31_14115, partial [Spirochaetaceae bacterium]|nr:hypothetical protein [Spirochaetaceae bacterium]
ADLSADYSSAFPSPSITYSGYPKYPNEVLSIKYELLVGGVALPATDPPLSVPWALGQLDDFTFDVTDLPAGGGNVTIRVMGFDTKDRVNYHAGAITDDPDAPLATGALVGANAYVDLTFNEPVWGGLNQTGALTPSHFYTDAPNGDPAITAVTPLAGDVSSGFTQVRLTLSFSPGEEPDRLDPLTIGPDSGTPPLDKVNNEWESTTSVELVDQREPTIESIDIGTISDGIDPGLPGGNQYVNEDDTVEFDVTFSEPVTVTGSPQLALDFNNDAIGDAYALYTSGPGLNAVHTFTYTVGAFDNTSVGVYLDYVPGNLDLNGATIEDESLLDLVDPGL